MDDLTGQTGHKRHPVAAAILADLADKRARLERDQRARQLAVDPASQSHQPDVPSIDLQPAQIDAMRRIAGLLQQVNDIGDRINEEAASFRLPLPRLLLVDVAQVSAGLYSLSFWNRYTKTRKLKNHHYGSKAA